MTLRNSKHRRQLGVSVRSGAVMELRRVEAFEDGSPVEECSFLIDAVNADVVDLDGLEGGFVGREGGEVSRVPGPGEFSC